MTSVFVSSVRSKGDFAGVFKYESWVGYFYLFDNRPDIQRKILDHIQIFSNLSLIEAE
jgi:hypothetical protein